MKLTASGTPFIYILIRNRFEQTSYAHHRLRRHGVGRRMTFDDCDPDAVAAAIAKELHRKADFAPVETEGAARAAQMIVELL